MSKVKVLIEHEDGRKQELHGDTVICFTVSNAWEFLNKKAPIVDGQGAFWGKEIPMPIYSDTISSLFASMIKNSSNGKVQAAFHLHMIANILEEKSKEIKREISVEERDEALDNAFAQFFKGIFQE